MEYKRDIEDRAGEAIAFELGVSYENGQTPRVEMCKTDYTRDGRTVDPQHSYTSYSAYGSPLRVDLYLYRNGRISLVESDISERLKTTTSVSPPYGQVCIEKYSEGWHPRDDTRADAPFCTEPVPDETAARDRIQALAWRVRFLAKKSRKMEP
jgi:hypothetical protein